MNNECEFCNMGSVPEGSWHMGIYIEQYAKFVNVLCQKYLSVTIVEKTKETPSYPSNVSGSIDKEE